MQETFKDIPNYEGIYQAGTLGNIKSLKRNKELILNPAIGAGGYQVVSLTKKGKCKTFKVSKLMGITYLNHTPNGNTLIIDHKDNIKTNDKLSNLQEITHRKNLSKDKTNTSSKYTGVCWFHITNKWMSYIFINGKRKHLGYFNNEIDAHNAYQKELNKIR